MNLAHKVFLKFEKANLALHRQLHSEKNKLLGADRRVLDVNLLATFMMFTWSKKCHLHGKD